MKRTDKEQLVTELTSKIKGAQALYFTDFTGLNVKRMTDLRRQLRRAGVEYVVIKNTLALRAVNESGLAGERPRGPTGLTGARAALGGVRGAQEPSRGGGGERERAGGRAPARPDRHHRRARRPRGREGHHRLRQG